MTESQEIIIADESGERIVHLLESHEEWAIKAAIAANRPLLLRGEPGIGKTQLALAAATLLNRPLVTLTVDANTESRELMWTFDAVQRLAEAQVVSATTTDINIIQDKIAVKNFIQPGPIWWAFDWDSATKQLQSNQKPPARMPPRPWKQEDGVVILIDEIDKAENDVPNGLLEAFGSREFTPQGWSEPIKLPDATSPPLMVITTNEERVLPDAFIRRCFVLNLGLPAVATRTPQTEDEKAKDRPFIDHLVARGHSHFPVASETLLNRAANLLLEDRRHVLQNHQTPLPGQAEYLDFLRAIMNLVARGDNENEIFEQVNAFVFKKAGKDEM